MRQQIVLAEQILLLKLNERRYDVKKILKSKKGSAIFQMIIVIAIVAILAVTTLPNLSDQIEAQGTKAIEKIDTVGDTLGE